MSHLERQDDILAILSNQKIASVSKLAETLYVSEATIRRDLIHMDNLGLIRRTHGGAMMTNNTAQESSFALREAENLTAKKTICSLAVQHITDHSVIYMDSSSTIMPIIPMLQRFHHLTVITHGIRTALLLANLENIDVFVAGGKVGNFSNSILGNSVIEFYEHINAEIALLSCSGINEKGDITDNSIEHAKIKRTIINKSSQVFMLVDHTKFDHTMMNTTFKLKDVDYLITDQTPSDHYLSIIDASNCKLIKP